MNFLAKNRFQIFVLIILSFLFINTGVVFCAENLSNWQIQLDKGASDKYKGAASTSNSTASGIATYVGTIIAWVPMLGITFIMQMVLAGYEWMTASGDTAKLDDAKKRIIHAVFGLCLFIGLYAIAYFVFDKLTYVANYQR